MSKKAHLIANIIFTVVMLVLLVYKLVKLISSPTALEWLSGGIWEWMVNDSYESPRDPGLISFTIAIYLAYTAPYITPILTIITLWLRGTPKMVMSIVAYFASGGLFTWEFICCGLTALVNMSSHSLDYFVYDPAVSLIELVVLTAATALNFVWLYYMKKYTKQESRLLDK